MGPTGSIAPLLVAIFLLVVALARALQARLSIPARLQHLIHRSSTSPVTGGDQIGPLPGEESVVQLASDFNGVLDRLDSTIRGQQQLVEDTGHELRTPLTIIGGQLELMQPADVQNVTETRGLLLQEVSRMQLMLDEFLLLAKSGRPDFLSPDWINADLFLKSALERVRGMSERHWQIEHLPGGWFRADRDRLNQAIDQLAANSARATEPGDIISIGAAWTVVSTNEDFKRRNELVLELWVADTGHGLSAAEQERILTPFARAGSREDVAGRPGLGLSLAKAIAEAHGGSIRFTSRVNVGSRFVLSLPSGSSWPAN
ncbi:sensor histidine kinase [Paenarthrobacter ureafaciens]|uniref:sensor histidine kinase n=1 Tax=Paenarthrobacter ureafaciens TaxID=37931 RepID=UPI00140B8D09|nr:HAMP domain-containing sensor histidine kinase [Paenarthrobacter ureafaciens]MCX8453699.1 HAMP domain-containing sensor histidine kinase [Paenarthrobacter ureafaciens]MCY0973358.1 HAMP domain-containing sensor histidine kinase [Paenarthrobacter ureafaciens]